MKGIARPWFNDSPYRGGSYQLRPPKKISWFSLFFGNLSITGWFILINVLFFIAVLLLGFGSVGCSENFCKYIAIQPENFLAKGYIWTLLTSMFMHGGFAHLLINMFVLFSLGGLCEKIIGRKRYIWFYILSGIFAGLLFVLLAKFFGTPGLGEKIFGAPLSYAVGASGAIFAIAGLFVMLTPKLKFYIIFLPFFSLPAYIMVPVVLFATWLVSSSVGLGIGNTAHFGGFLAGIAYGLYLKNKYKRKTKMINELFSA